MTGARWSVDGRGRGWKNSELKGPNGSRLEPGASAASVPLGKAPSGPVPLILVPVYDVSTIPVPCNGDDSGWLAAWLALPTRRRKHTGPPQAVTSDQLLQSARKLRGRVPGPEIPQMPSFVMSKGGLRALTSDIACITLSLHLSHKSEPMVPHFPGQSSLERNEAQSPSMLGQSCLPLKVGGPL